MWNRTTGRMAGYNPDRLKKDLLAGTIVGIVALPLAMAFAIASGVSPDRGLFTAIIAGAAISIFGGSRVQIGGPTGAMVPVLLATVVQYGLENLLLAGFVAGVMLILMGLMRAGALIRFIPFPVTTGFTSGIAVVIFSGQINNFLGLIEVPKHDQFHMNLIESFARLPLANFHALGIAGIALAGIVLTPFVTRIIPGSLVGLIGATAAATWLDWSVPTIGSQFGGIPRTLPLPSFPDITFSGLLYVLRPAFTIAVLGAIESLLSCVVADSRSGDRHDPNRELVGQGIANCLSPLFGGIPATGAIARTATNIRSGASSPVAGVVHAVVLLLILLALAPLAASIPLAALAPVLMVVAYNMSEIPQVLRIARGPRSDAMVLAITLFLTVFADLSVAVEFGLLLSAILFIKHMSDVHQIEKVLPDAADPKKKLRGVGSSLVDCPQALFLSVEGPLFFGAAQKFEQDVLRRTPTIRTLVLRMAKVPFIDASGTEALTRILDDCKRRGILVMFSGLQEQPRQSLVETQLLLQIGGDNIFSRTGPALDRAIARMDVRLCAVCPHHVFRECEGLKRKGVLEMTGLARESDSNLR